MLPTAVSLSICVNDLLCTVVTVLILFYEELSYLDILLYRMPVAHCLCRMYYLSKGMFLLSFCRTGLSLAAGALYFKGFRIG